VRRIALAWAVAAAGLWIVGAAARWVPRGWLPDPALLAAVGLGLHVGGPPGALGAWAIGWTADLLSGGVLGQFALLNLVVWAAARAAQSRVDLERPLVLVPFVLGLALGQAAGLWALGRVPRAGPETLALLLPFAAANVAGALALRPLWNALLAGVDGSEAPRGTLRLGTSAGLR
jgi:hypothetical protein